MNLKNENFEWESGKEILSIYVSPEFKEEYKKHQDKKKMLDEAITNKVKELREGIEDELNNFEEDLLIYKANTIKYRKQFEDTYKGMLESLEKAYSNLNTKQYEFKNKIESMRDAIKDVDKNINSLTDKINNISTYKLERFLELASKITNMSAKEKRIMGFLMNKADEIL